MVSQNDILVPAGGEKREATYIASVELADGLGIDM